MYRSASTNRVADDHHFLYHPSSSLSSSSASAAASSTSKGSTTLRALSLEANELPVYESMQSSEEAVKKERSRDIMAQNAVHIIPLLLILCAVILWFLSTPDIDMSAKGGITSGGVEGLGVEIDGDSDGTQKGHIPFDLDDLSTTRQDDHENHRKFLATKLPKLN